MDIRFLFLIAIVLYLAQNFTFRRFGLSKIQYTRRFSDPYVYAGQDVELIEFLENDKWLPLPWLTIESLFPSGLHFANASALHSVIGEDLQHHQSLFTLAPYTRVTRRHKITCIQRGVYGLQEPTLTCGDLFGATSPFLKVQVDSKLIVYPAILSNADMPIEFHSWQGEITVRRYSIQDPFTFSGIRDYTDGDPQNQIHWAAFARTGKLQVYRHETTADYRIMILINFEITEEMWDMVTDNDLLERGLSYAATLTKNAIANGLLVGFASNGMVKSDVTNMPYLTPCGGQEYLHIILTTLATMIMRCGCSFRTLMEQELRTYHSPTDYLILSAHFSEDILVQKNNLEAAGHSVTCFHLQ